VLSSTCRSGPAAARSWPAKATADGEFASMMLAQIRVLPLSSAATGPLITRLSTRAAPAAVTRTLAAPGLAGVPSDSSPCPGTRVESLTWTVQAAPATASCPASQTPLISSCPAVGAAPDGETVPASPVTSRSPLIVTREFFQLTASGAVAPGSGWPARRARLAPGGSWIAAAPAATVSAANPVSTITPVGLTGPEPEPPDPVA